MAMLKECEHTESFLICPQCDPDEYARSLEPEEPEPLDILRMMDEQTGMDEDEEEITWDS